MRRLPVRLALVFLLLPATLFAQAPPLDPTRWEPTIAAFEAQDHKNPPPKGGIVFVGASSIVRWNVSESFPDLPVINRGFGGSELTDTVHFASRTVLPYEPGVVVLYPGENDIARGVAPGDVAAAFERLVTTVRAALPRTRLLVIGMKPTPARWRFNELMLETNGRFREIAGRYHDVTYISVEKAMLGPDRKPRLDLFVDDGQHLNRAGYELWTDILRPHLD